jgi:serine/threonine-protein kinase
MRRLRSDFVLGERYVLGNRIASGGMADVWEALDQTLQRLVAVKVMRPDIEHEETFRLRFRDEALHAAALLHTNIATVFDYGEDDGLAYLVMERVDGRTLGQVVREEGPIDPERVRSIIGQAALALGVAHEQRRPPRREAGEHPAARRRAREAHRLRHRPGDRRRGPHAHR